MTVEQVPLTVVPLRDAADPARFGAKAASLARLARTHRVPDGFAVSADVAERFAGLPEAEAALKLRVLVAPAYATLGRGLQAAVAVRSSAIGEDSADASFAGQHDTVLDVRGVDAVVRAVLEVWRSATSDRAVAYRREKGIGGAPRVGVLVQRMCDATASAIAFTSDPITGDREVVTVNAVEGVGDAMASGEVTPDLFQVSRGGEIVWRKVDGAPAITDDQVKEVAGLAVELEREMGHPVDIEAAYERGELWLLQCRPVTAAGDRHGFPVTWVQPGDEAITWQREDAHYGGARTPLAVDYTRFGANVGIQRRNARLGPPVAFRFEEFNGYIYVGTRPLVPADEVPRHQADAREKRKALGRRLVRDWTARYLPAVLRQYEWMRALRPADGDPDAVAAAWDELWRRVSDVWEIHMLITGGSYVTMDELAETYERLTGRPGAEAFALTHGRAETLQRLQQDTFALAETARVLPLVAEAIRHGVERLDVLRDLEGGEPFAAAFARFLEAHGDLGQPSEDIVSPAWSDEPALLLREIRRALEAPPEDPRSRLERLLAEGDALAERVRRSLRERPEELAAFEDALAVARAVGPLTEEHNYWIDRLIQAHVRRAALAFGARMVADGTVAEADDIFYFYVGEAADALRHPRDLRGFVAERRARHARNARLHAPEFVGAAPAGPPPGLGTVPSQRVDLLYKVRDQSEPGVLRGVAASAGRGRGPARLVRSVADLDRVRPGDVLVCRSTNVSYVPVFGKVAAVVTEVGGSLSHAAVVAREFGVPCVVATGVALTELRDGELVEVDGTAGVVRRSGAAPEKSAR